MWLNQSVNTSRAWNGRQCWAQHKGDENAGISSQTTGSRSTRHLGVGPGMGKGDSPQQAGPSPRPAKGGKQTASAWVFWFPGAHRLDSAAWPNACWKLLWLSAHQREHWESEHQRTWISDPTDILGIRKATLALASTHSSTHTRCLPGGPEGLGAKHCKSQSFTGRDKAQGSLLQPLHITPWKMLTTQTQREEGRLKPAKEISQSAQRPPPPPYVSHFTKPLCR